MLLHKAVVFAKHDVCSLVSSNNMRCMQRTHIGQVTVIDTEISPKFGSVLSEIMVFIQSDIDTG